MIARTLQVAVEPDAVDGVVAAYRRLVRPIHEAAPGLRAHYVVVDRGRGLVEFIGIWESAEAVQAIAERLEPARAELWSSFGRDPDLNLFEVVDEIAPRS